ncbi:glycosyltransferase family 39 protein [Actinomadura sp. ATCC 31491]|uniref:Glycosyltransferase family 39 protein n=1 Tax=Actinomadura luzonensis TaxID=2805427 RepID=A0ABT0G414_9ACTN|nr:glycosyltransferase family 39 protein [Actinomadura luzonensis]MCK2219254.1 glycosyltransferase family 39 protein [Actinomadura luzonensis]
MERPLAWRSVTVIAVLLFGALLALSPWYGYHRDELYFRVLSEHPAWGYVDQPPLTPLLAGAGVGLFGDTVTGIRVFPALAVAVLVWLVALITRELDGGRLAQAVAAAGTATGAYTLIAGHTLLTLSFDLPLWAAAILFLLKALLREQEPRWWLAAGAVIGLATYNKHLIALLVLGLAAGLLLAGPRRALRSPWLWAGAALALALAVPNLLYQVTNDWPQLKMAAALSADKGAELRVLFVPMQLTLFGPAVSVIAVFGFVRLWRDRRVRALAVAYPVAAALTLLSGGRFDYTGGLILLLFAAGCVTVGAAARRARWWAVAGLAASGLCSAVLALPLVPVADLAATPVPGLNEVARESVGWPAFVAAVQEARRAIPPAEQATAVVFTGSYGEHGALVRAGVPRVYSGHNQLWLYGPPPDTGTTAVLVNVGPRARAQFGSCEQRATVDNGAGLENEEQGLGVWLCRGLRTPWSVSWPRWRHFS